MKKGIPFIERIISESDFDAIAELLKYNVFDCKKRYLNVPC